MGIFNKVKERERKLFLETPGKHPGNTQESPGKHPGKVHLLIFCIKGAGLERKKTSLAILVGILNKEKEKNNAPGKHPGNSRGKVYLLMFSIKGAGLET